MEPQNLLTISIKRDVPLQRKVTVSRAGRRTKTSFSSLYFFVDLAAQLFANQPQLTIMSRLCNELLLISSTLTCEVLRNLNALLPVRAALRVDRVINFILLQMPIQQEQFAVIAAIRFYVIAVVCFAVDRRRR
jgi:hypothetical protein